jgi:hypothetical protein
MGEGTDNEARASSSRVRIIFVEWASREFSRSSLIMVGMSRISCPLEIFWIVVGESFVIIFKSKSKSKRNEAKERNEMVRWFSAYLEGMSIT